MSRPQPEASTVECVVDTVGAARVLRFTGDGQLETWLDVAMRQVPVYWYASVAARVVMLALVGELVRPVVAGWSWWQHAALAVALAMPLWAITGRLSRHVWERLVESVVADTAHAVLAVRPCPERSDRCPWANGAGPVDGGADPHGH